MTSHHEEFDIPFPPRRNPLLPEAEARHFSWMRGMGLFEGPDAEALYRRWNPADVAARWLYLGSVDDLALLCDFVGWFFCFDDQFDGPLGRDPEAVRAIIERIAAVVFDREPGALHVGAYPLATAFSDLWTRQSQGMSPAWRERAAAHWSQYLHAHLIETANRAQSRWPSVSEYLVLRFRTGFMPPLLDTIERVWHCELPPPAYGSPELQRMRYIASQNINIVNDVLSLDKEEDHGDHHNLVLIIQHERGCSRREAINEARRMVDEWTREFVTTEPVITEMCDRLHLPIAHRTGIYTYIEGMRAAIRGNYDWCARSSRYASYRPHSA